MKNAYLRCLMSCIVLACLMSNVASATETGVVIVANASLKDSDRETLRRIYTGRVITVNGQVVRPVNLTAGSPLRVRFLNEVLKQSEEDYLGYWTVRRYIGKGVPPPEVASSDEVLDWVKNTPGAVGYVEDRELPEGVIGVLPF